MRFRFAAILMSIVFAVSLSGCGVTLSPVKRKPLSLDPPPTSLVPTNHKVLVRMENTLPDKPLCETVWDNASGAFWDVEECKQIGFTQNYNKLIPAAVIGGALGGAIGGAVIGATTGPSLVETRIVIPFGRIFESAFQAQLPKVFPNSAICFDDACEKRGLSTGTPTYLIRVKVTEFQVWEGPLNHLNLKSAVVSRVFQPQNLAEPLSVYEGRQELNKQSLGSVLSTSGGFIAEMNQVSNRFAGALTTDILGRLQTGLVQ